MTSFLGDYLRPFSYSPKQDRGSFFRFLLTGGLAGAGVLTVMGFGAASIQNPVIWALFVLLALWWLLSIVAATWRRLGDAGADPWLALVWPFLPLAAAVGFGWPILLSSLQILLIPIPDQLRLATVLAVVFAAVPLALMIVACATPTGDWRWPDARLMFWIAVVYSPLLALLCWAGAKLIRRISRPNLGTRLGLLASFIGLSFMVGAEYLDLGTRAVALVLVGLVFTAFHLLRWVLQERHFSHKRVAVDYANGDHFAVADPRWRRPWAARVFKALGIVWIWTVVLAAIPRDPAGSITIVWTVLITGYLIYLVWPALPAGLGTIYLLLANWSGDDLILRGFAAPMLVIFGLSAVWFGMIWFFVPTDNRYKFTGAFRRYLSGSEW